MEEASKIALSMGLDIAFEKIGGFDPVAFDPDCVGAIRQAAETLGYSHRTSYQGQVMMHAVLEVAELVD